jgi:hypothetical protein
MRFNAKQIISAILHTVVKVNPEYLIAGQSGAFLQSAESCMMEPAARL